MDLDLGNYERFLDIQLHRDNNITTGKIYRQVIERERKGEYLGKSVQGTCTLCTYIHSTFQFAVCTYIIILRLLCVATLILLYTKDCMYVVTDLQSSIYERWERQGRPICFPAHFTAMGQLVPHS